MNSPTLLIMLLLLVAAPLSADEPVYLRSADVRRALTSALREAQAATGKVEKAQIKRKQARGKLSEQQQQVSAFQAEWRQALEELRQGLYCSKCKRPRSQILREANEDFQTHLGRVNGEPVPATEEHKASKKAEYDSKIDSAEKRLDQTRTKIRESEAKISEGESKLRRIGNRWHRLEADERSLRDVEESMFLAETVRIESRLADHEINIEVARDIEEAAKARTKSYHSGDDLRWLDPKERFEALAGNQAYRDAKLERLQREKARIAETQGLHTKRRERHQQLEARTAALAALETDRKALVARWKRAGLSGGSMDWNWVRGETTSGSQARPHDWETREVAEQEADIREQVLKATELNQVERQAAAEGTRRDLEYIDDLRRKASYGTEWAGDLMKEKLAALQKGLRAGKAKARAATRVVVEAGGEFARDAAEDTVLEGGDLEDGVKKTLFGRAKALVKGGIDKALDAVTDARGRTKEALSDRENTHLMQVFGDLMDRESGDAYKRALEKSPTGSVDNILDEPED